MHKRTMAQVSGGRRAVRWSTVRGAEPLHARIKGANREVSEEKADLWTRFVFFLRGPTRSGKRARFPGRFAGMHMALNGWMLERALAYPAQGLHRQLPRYFNVPYFCMTCGPENLKCVDQNRLERNLSALLLRTLAVGRQQSKSIDVVLDI